MEHNNFLLTKEQKFHILFEIPDELIAEYVLHNFNKESLKVFSRDLSFIKQVLLIKAYNEYEYGSKERLDKFISLIENTSDDLVEEEYNKLSLGYQQVDHCVR